MKKKIMNMILVGLILAGIDSIAYASAVDNEVNDVEKIYPHQLHCWAWSKGEKYKAKIFWNERPPGRAADWQTDMFYYDIENLVSGLKWDGAFGNSKGMYHFNHKDDAAVIRSGVGENYSLSLKGEFLQILRVTHFAIANIELKHTKTGFQLLSFFENSGFDNSIPSGSIIAEGELDGVKKLQGIEFETSYCNYKGKF